MSRWWGQLLAGFVAVAGCATLAGACSHDDSSMYVVGVLSPPDGSCTYKGDPSSVQLGEGKLDVAFASGGYMPWLLVANQMIARVSADNLRTETNVIIVQGAEVTVSDAGGRELSAFSSRTTGTLTPSVGGAPGYVAVKVTLVDQTSVNRLLDESGPYRLASRPDGRIRVVSTVKVFGQTLGGRSVESNEFQFPVTVCLGCLVDFPADSVDKTLAATRPRNCLGASGTTGQRPCVFGQDQAVDCRLCQGNPYCDPAFRVGGVGADGG